MNRLVSIITPCYNGETFLHRWAESILHQTYRPIEVIFVDDGSTDRTAQLFQFYSSRFEAEGITVHYCFQENAGIGAAINVGFSKFTGDYIIWLDSDDYLLPESIALRVDYLEHHRECGLVRSDGVKVNEDSPFIPLDFVSKKRKNRFRADIFDDILMSQTFPLPGSYMLRTSSFMNVFPDRRIYPYRIGHNYQIILPMSLRFRCGYIDSALWVFVSRSNSVTKITTGGTLESRLHRVSFMENVVLHVLNEIGDQAESYKDWVLLKYMRERLMLACRYHDKNLGRANYAGIRKIARPGMATWFWYFASQYSLVATLRLRIDSIMRRVVKLTNYVRTRVVCHMNGVANEMKICERRCLDGHVAE